jgi:hypothetical protein
MLGDNFKLIVNICLVLFCCVVNIFLSEIKKIEDCPIAKWQQVNNGIALINLLFVATLINCFIPIHNFLYHLPLIGSWYIFIFGIWIFIILYIITSLSNQIRENDYTQCVNDKTKLMYNTFKTNTTITNVFCSILFTIIYFYVLQ